MELWTLLWNPKLYWNIGTPSLIRVILELWISSLLPKLYWNSGFISLNSELYWNSGFHLYSQSYIGTLELYHWTRSYIGTLILTSTPKSYTGTLEISQCTRSYMGTLELSQWTELYGNSEFISVNMRFNLKLKNYLYELITLIELWNNKFSYFRNCSHWNTRFQIQRSWTFLKLWTGPPKPTSRNENQPSYNSKSLHSKGNLEHLQNRRKNAP